MVADLLFSGQDIKVRSIRMMIAIRSSWRVVQRCRSRTWFCSCPKKLSIAALSPAESTLRIDPTGPWRRSAQPVNLKRPEVFCRPPTGCGSRLRAA